MGNAQVGQKPGPLTQAHYPSSGIPTEESVIAVIFLGHFTVWAFLLDQMVKNLPAIREPWVQSLGWENPLEKKGMATHSSILAWEIP